MVVSGVGNYAGVPSLIIEKSAILIGDYCIRKLITSLDLSNSRFAVLLGGEHLKSISKC